MSQGRKVGDPTCIKFQLNYQSQAGCISTVKEQKDFKNCIFFVTPNIFWISLHFRRTYLSRYILQQLRHYLEDLFMPGQQSVIEIAFFQNYQLMQDVIYANHQKKTILKKCGLRPFTSSQSNWYLASSNLAAISLFGVPDFYEAEFGSILIAGSSTKNIGFLIIAYKP